jgi:flavin reductase (DIM6/NTAB) family NADH-FMN oxidoreductase RutF
LDFAVNIPADPALPLPHRLMTKAAFQSPVLIDDVASLVPARSVHAPLLSGCALQIECAVGRFVPGEWDVELAGEILLLHRGDIFLDPARHADFCALQPLHAIFPS